MSDCQDRPTLFPEALWKALMNLPALRYMKAPVDTVAELYEKYRIGNEKGTFAFVHNDNTFYTYHPRGWSRGEWKPISADGVSTFFEIDAEFLKDGDILVYDSNKKKFVVKSGNVWNNLLGELKGKFSQVSKFLNQTDSIPNEESTSGVYFIHNDKLRALYLVLGQKVIKIFNSSDYKTKEEIDEALDKKLDKSEIGNITAGILFQDIEVANTSQLTNPLPNGQVPKDKWAVWVESEGKYYMYDASSNKWSPTPFTAKPSSYITDKEVDREALGLFKIIQNDEFCLLVIDSENKGLFGIRWDASIFMPRIPYNVLEKINKSKLEIQEQISYIVDTFKISESGEWLDVKFDANGKILEGTRIDGSKYIAKGMSEDARKAINKILVDLNKKVISETGKSLIDEVFASCIKSTDSDEFLEQTLDKEGKLLGYRTTRDGVRYESKLRVDDLKLTDKGMSQFMIDLKNNGFISGTGDYTGQNNLRLPIPKHAGMLNITAKKLPTTKTDDIPSVCELYLEGAYLKFNAINNAQGSSSLALGYPRLNMSLDYFVHTDDNSFDKELKIKFGDWVEQDAYYLKVYYIDSFRGQCIVSYRICEDMYNTLPYGERLPWEYLTLKDVTTSDATGTLKDDFGDGAKAISDGFAVMIYFNGEPFGIGIIRLKKHRDNMNMKKSDPKHIYLDGALNKNSIFGGTLNWTSFEIRNPKDLKTVSGGKYDGNNPTEITGDSSIDTNTATVKASIERLATACPIIKANQTKAEFENYFRPIQTIEYILHAQAFMNFDGFDKNWLWCSWDGSLFAPMFHDHDSIWSQFWNGIVIDNERYDPSSTILGLDEDLPSGLCQKLYKEEIKARYKQLRDNGVFSVEHIIGKLEEWINHVGYNNYKFEFEKWSETPSYRKPLINSEYWEFYITGAGNPVYDNTKNYAIGEIARYGKTEASVSFFKCIKPCQGVPPLTGFYNSYPYEMGFYNSIARVQKWLEERFTFLDTYYEYN